MISAVSWIPKGVSVLEALVADPPPSKKEKDIEESMSESENDDSAEPSSHSVVVSARYEGQGPGESLLEVWIFEDTGGLKLCARREIEISAFVACTAWLDCPLQGGERGNFLAVGSMKPYIQIWDLDLNTSHQMIMEVRPCRVLAGHTDSVYGLAWNKENLLASASADKRVKIWNVVAGKCDITMEHHSDKVLAVAWNHHAPQVLVSGSLDRTVVMKDGRMPSHSGYKWSVTAGVQSLAWDPHTEHSFVASLANGFVKCFDVRTAKSDSTSELSSIFTLHAHDKAVTSVSYNLSAPNLLATGSSDKTVKLWDLSNNQPSCVASKTPEIGAILSISFSEDKPFLLAIGGSRGTLRVWDTLSYSGISRRYQNYNSFQIQIRNVWGFKEKMSRLIFIPMSPLEEGKSCIRRRWVELITTDVEGHFWCRRSRSSP